MKTTSMASISNSLSFEITSPTVAAISSSLTKSSMNTSNVIFSTDNNDNMKDDDALDVIILILKASIMVI